jgi:hypothetical protein
MALVDFHYAFVKLGDSRGKVTEVRYRVSSTSAAAYFTALTQILKDATPVGLLLADTELLSACSMMGKGVMLVTEDDAQAFPGYDTDIFIFDKLAVHYRAGFDNYQVTIPGRDSANYTMETDGVHVNPTLGAVDDYITHFNAVVLAKNGTAGIVQNITVPS